MSRKQKSGKVLPPIPLPDDLKPGDILVCNRGERLPFRFRDAEGDIITNSASDASWWWSSSDGRDIGSPEDRWITEIIRANQTSRSATAQPTHTAQSAEDSQVGGDHYRKLKIQPMRYSMENGLDACQHTIIKYVTRFRDKGGIADLEKARHTIDLLIQFEREKQS